MFQSRDERARRPSAAEEENIQKTAVVIYQAVIAGTASHSHTHANTHMQTHRPISYRSYIRQCKAYTVLHHRTEDLLEDLMSLQHEEMIMTGSISGMSCCIDVR